jgi:hypothetical protein
MRSHPQVLRVVHKGGSGQPSIVDQLFVVGARPFGFDRQRDLDQATYCIRARWFVILLLGPAFNLRPRCEREPDGQHGILFGGWPSAFFRCYLFCRVRSGTPDPPPFSSLNSMPAVSSAEHILVPVSCQPPKVHIHQSISRRGRAGLI